MSISISSYLNQLFSSLEIKSNLLKSGQVSLVGAGPGDVELLTLKALRRINEADVVLYDNLVGLEILKFVSANAQSYYVGKKAAQHALPQDEVNNWLIRLAQEGKRVVRLKGGDPFVFGRGGEELDALLTAGVSVEVVPGITAAVGCAAYAGIPLTHRDWAQSVTFATGHLKQGLKNLDWEALSRPAQTVVFYMGMTAASNISEALIAHGRQPDTPVAVIYHGTRPDQKVVIATLATLVAKIHAEGIKPPALMIIGEVVRLYPSI